MLLVSCLGHVWRLCPGSPPGLQQAQGLALLPIRVSGEFPSRSPCCAHNSQYPHPIFQGPHAAGGQDAQCAPCREGPNIANVCGTQCQLGRQPCHREKSTGLEAKNLNLSCSLQTSHVTVLTSSFFSAAGEMVGTTLWELWRQGDRPPMKALPWCCVPSTWVLGLCV